MGVIIYYTPLGLLFAVLCDFHVPACLKTWNALELWLSDAVLVIL
jgi:hypothetical protein